MGRKNRISHFIRQDYGAQSGSHSAGETQRVLVVDRHYKFNETPELWRKHAHEPWKVIFPDLDWKPPEID